MPILEYAQTILKRVAGMMRRVVLSILFSCGMQVKAGIEQQIADCASRVSGQQGEFTSKMLAKTYEQSPAQCKALIDAFAGCGSIDFLDFLKALAACATHWPASERPRELFDKIFSLHAHFSKSAWRQVLIGLVDLDYCPA